MRSFGIRARVRCVCAKYIGSVGLKTDVVGCFIKLVLLLTHLFNNLYPPSYMCIFLSEFYISNYSTFFSPACLMQRQLAAQAKLCNAERDNGVKIAD